jgi:hypothetical protein
MYRLIPIWENIKKTAISEIMLAIIPMIKDGGLIFTPLAVYIITVFPNPRNEMVDAIPAIAIK